MTYCKFQAFERFIQILIAQENRNIINDVHVMPFWKRCDMCNLNYDLIGKMETFTQDSNYIMEKIGMKSPKIVVAEKEHVSSGNSSEEMAKNLFARLPNDLIEKLYDLYKLDFEMFDYEYKQYLS